MVPQKDVGTVSVADTPDNAPQDNEGNESLSMASRSWKQQAYVDLRPSWKRDT